MTSPKPRPGVMQIDPYVGGASKLAGVRRVMKLSSNEGALGPSPKAIEAFRALAPDMYRYPDGGSAVLRRAIGDRHGLDPDRVVCGAGSDELIGLLCHAYAGEGDEVLYPEHGFLMYAIYAKLAGATPVTAPETALTADVDALLAAVSERTRIVFLANPNNPTGTYLPAAELARLRAGLRDDILLVIDGAYAEYVGLPDYSCGMDLADAHDNVAVTRTFSKLHGLGGLRLGWAYAAAPIVDVLNRARSPFNVNAAAQAAGAAAIADVEHQGAAKAHNDRWHPWLAGRLNAAGITTTPGVGNFVLARFPEPGTAAEADAFLKNRGIIVRRMEAYGLPESLRITVGPAEEVEACAAAMEAFMRGDET